MWRALTMTCCLGLALSRGYAEEPKKTREQKVREDRAKVESAGYWIYNDLAKGYAEARQSGRPMIVILRCIPCEECVKLDDELMDNDPKVRPLLDQFVRVRIVGTNGLDLSLFQFDTDQSFTAFLLNADGTIYGRFGTRSHRTEWVGDVSLEGLAQALEGALELHQVFPRNREILAAKRGPKPEFASPELFPELKEKFSSTLNYEGNVVQSCIHCHQIGDAMRDLHRSRKQPIPETVLFPYPHPKSIGLILDPKERATITAVTADSPAAHAGFQAGDQIRTLAGQPLLSMADVQWVLHQTSPEGGTLAAQVLRNGKESSVSLALEPGWRRRDTIAWRASSWGLRRMATGGLFTEQLSPEDRQAAGITGTGMALKVKHVGQYGPHATAKQAGFQKDDIITEFDGHADLLRECDLLAYGVTQHLPGDSVKVKIIRNGRPLELTLPLQK
jgi:serine protease Do